MSSVDFVLEKFDYDLEMGVSGEFPSATIPVLDASATAVYYASVSDMRNAFYFQSDSRDVSDNASSDVRYYVNWPAKAVLNPCHAYVLNDPIATVDGQGDIESTRLLVKHDFIRHIAKDLFNTHLGVDLFSNEQALKDDLASKGNDAWLNNIKANIDAVSSGGNLTTDGYTTNELDGSANLCRTLLLQLLNSPAKSRLNDLSGIALDASENTFVIPFESGDSIQFKLILKASPGQNNVINRATAVADRSYIIKVNIVTTVSADSSTYAANTNVIVDDCTDTDLNTSHVKQQ